MQCYTTLQFFKRPDYFDIVIAYNVAPGRFRERVDVKVPSQFIQDGRNGRYISKSFPEYPSAIEKINKLQEAVEKIVEDYVLKNKFKPDSDWVRSAYDGLQSEEMKQTVVVSAVGKSEISTLVPSATSIVPHTGGLSSPYAGDAQPQPTPYPTHALAAKLVRGLNSADVSTGVAQPPVSPVVQASPVDQVSELSGDLFRFWTEFMDVRKVVRREDATFNELDSLRNTLHEFSVAKNRVLSFGCLDQAFFVDLVHFLISEYSYQINPLAAPVIGLRNETAMRRLRDLKTYVDYSVSEEYVKLNVPRMERYILVARRKYGVKKLSDTQNWELALCKEELEFVVNLDYYEPEFYWSLSPSQRRYIDIFAFMSLQGTAPIDTMNLTRADIQNGIILKDRSKTDTAFKVEVDPISMVILERNNYNLDFNDTTFNRAIKGIFVTVFEFFKIRFGQLYEQVYRRPYSLVERQMRKKGREVVYEIKHRGMFVEAMTGRRTFITLLAGKSKELGIKRAMEKVGHKKPSTFLGYVHETEVVVDSLLGVEKIQT